MATAQAKNKYFQSTKRGEIKDWKDDLNGFDKEKIKDAVKKVIAAMTVGKDVSSLFVDVIKSMPTDNLELKKLVYLYIINYARTQPDKAIAVINTFIKDASKPTSPNPLVRALAIRTMGCIRVDQVVEHLCEPLGRALEDDDPYVRKTAAICVAKLFDISPELAHERGFLPKLRDLLTDGAPMVVANAVAALSEISETGQSDVFKITPQTLKALLNALNDCTEWGQVFILDALAKYEPSEDEVVEIVERVSPRLKHTNSALVLSAIKVIMKYLDIMNDADSAAHAKKLAPPLVSLLSTQPEIQYVALRNIDLIVQKRPQVLSKEIRVFFCKYNDPVYVKMEKLEILIKLSSSANIDQLLLEFKEYAQAVDVEFVRKSVRAIGRCAIKLESAAENCVRTLLELIDTKVSYVVQEAVIVIKDIFRRYPNTYEGVIVNLCANLDSLDEPEAKGAMIWIIGEYAERIEDAGERLGAWIETFEDEVPDVQLQLLTATVKLFLKRPDVGKEIVRKVLQLCTESVENPDLRDRGYVYWRLLSNDPVAAKEIVLADKPVISDETFRIDGKVLDILIANIATLASVYHKPPENFVRGIKTMVFHAAAEDEDKKDGSEEEEEEEDEEEEEEGEEEEVDEEELERRRGNVGSGGDSSDEEKSAASPRTVFPETKQYSVLSADKGNGLQIVASSTQVNGVPNLILRFKNTSDTDHSKFAIQFNKNYLGVSPVSPAVNLSTPLAPSGATATAYIPLKLDNPPDASAKMGIIQVALKTKSGILYFAAPLSGHIFFETDGKIAKKDFLETWKSIPATQEQKLAVESPSDEIRNKDSLSQKLESINVFFIASLEAPSKGTCVYFSMKFRGVVILCEVVIGSSYTISMKSSDDTLANAASKSVKFFLTS